MARKVSPKKIVLKKPSARRAKRTESKKPIVGVGALVALVIFAGLALFILVLNRQKEKEPLAELAPVESAAPLFAEDSATLSSIKIQPKEGEAIQIARDEKNVWAFELPEKAEADQGAVTAATSQISALQADATLPADAQPSIFGVDAPAYLITLKFGNQAHTLEVGDATPTNSGYYVRVDKTKIVIVSLSGIDALTQMVDFPPYAATPAPEVNATPIP